MPAYFMLRPQTLERNPIHVGQSPYFGQILDIDQPLSPVVSLTITPRAISPGLQITNVGEPILEY